jgi:hypothetical protein
LGRVHVAVSVAMSVGVSVAMSVGVSVAVSAARVERDLTHPTPPT